ncbi:hypothetical protein D1872_295880 [compost metagenome]
MRTVKLYFQRIQLVRVVRGYRHEADSIKSWRSAKLQGDAGDSVRAADRDRSVRDFRAYWQWEINATGCYYTILVREGRESG